MKIDVLVAEIGSTTTIVNAFMGINTDRPYFLGQGQAPTSVLQGDVTLGLKAAIASLQSTLGVSELSWDEFLATSSAAGGLRMSVHGLVYDMTVRAAQEAALGAGGILKIVTAGKVRRSEISQVKDIQPNIILIAGGVDYGERDTALFNFEAMAKACPQIPIIYCGNKQNQEDIKELAGEYNTTLYLVDNVYPKVDTLNVEPTRKVIQDAFEEHIIHAPGMSSVRNMVKGPIIPTPGAVMEAAKLLYEELGDLMVFDVGGATTDLHSVTEGSFEIDKILLSPEPKAKRTVEGDLGVFVNMEHIVKKIGMDNLLLAFPDAQSLLDNMTALPKSSREKEFIERLTKEAVHTALERHAGKLSHLFGPTGKKTVATGKDLTQIKYIIGTGGALTRLPERVNILNSLVSLSNGIHLYPGKDSKIFIDNHYIMASLGVLSKRFKESALKILKESLKI